MTFSLFKLPHDVLLRIFDFLDENQLLKSRLVDSRWKSLVDDDGLWLRKFLRLTNNLNPKWPDCHLYSWKQRYFYAKKWSRGRVDRCQVMNFRRKYIPWLQLCPVRPNEHLWLSWGTRIDRLPLIDIDPNSPSSAKRHRRQNENFFFNGQLENDDFCRFVIQKSISENDHVWAAGGTRSGRLYYFKKSIIDQSSHGRGNRYDRENRYRRENRFLENGYFQAHDSDLHCVDLLLPNSLSITGSRDRTVKIWKMPLFDSDSFVDQQPILKSTLKLGDRAWCLKANQKKLGQVIVGSAACWNDCPPLTLWDIESERITGRLGQPCKRGAGVLDLAFTSEHTILSGGYDSVVRLWDLRTPDQGRSVWSWEETYNSSVYSLISDGDNSLFVGTSRYGLVWLVDTRCRKATQNFYVGSDNRPVYSMAAATKSLYVGLDTEICALRCQ